VTTAVPLYPAKIPRGSWDAPRRRGSVALTRNNAPARLPRGIAGLTAQAEENV
jgi:hypothetical protein